MNNMLLTFPAGYCNYTIWEQKALKNVCVFWQFGNVFVWLAEM